METGRSDFWQNRQRAVKISRKAEELEEEVDKWKELKGDITELEELVAEAQKEFADAKTMADKGDAFLYDEFEEKYQELKKSLASFEFLVLFSSKYDRLNAILSIHAGTGGVDAQDWAEILERMYLRFAEKKGWFTEILDRNPGGEAGIKSVTIRISGAWAYGYLRSEGGVHRLVRISPFDAEAMRHTSFALAEVIPELPAAEEMEIREENLEFSAFRSSGPGGQNVNKTSSAVRLTHKPTGLTVTCQSERSQHQNRENALSILKAKLYKLREAEKEKEELKLRGEAQKAEWGKQIRSYVMQPYQLVKDHRTNFSTADIKAVLDGQLDGFMEEYLRQDKKSRQFNNS